MVLCQFVYTIAYTENQLNQLPMATFKVTLYKQKTLSDGTHPVMLQVIHDRKPYKISLGYSCKPEFWDESKDRFRKSFEGYKTKNDVLRNAETKAESILNHIKYQEKPFTQSFSKSCSKATPKTLPSLTFLES